MNGAAVPLLLLSLFSSLLFIPSAAIETKMQRLDGGPLQSFEPDILDITGPFFVEITAVVFNLSRSSQKFFDFSFVDNNGNSSRHITLLRIGNSNHVAFQYQDDDDNETYLVAEKALTTDTIDTWRVGVDAAGTVEFSKNGVSLASGTANPPTGALLRSNKALGHSSSGSSNQLGGTILGLKVQNLSDPVLPIYRQLFNLPAQAFRVSFVASAYARFDDTSRSSQRIFEFSELGSNDNQISFGQDGTGNDLVFESQVDGIPATCVASSAIIEGEMAHWAVEVSPTHWKIAKNGSVKVACFGKQAPASVFRRQLNFGESSSGSDRLDGVVLGFRLDDGFVPA